MGPSRLERVLELFEASMKIPHSERRRFFQERCEGDEVLLRELLEMVEQDERDGEYMDPPGQTELQRATTRSASEDLSGARLGPYRLERIIGRGGMGAVYLAQRVDGDFEQDVAIKLIRRGLDTDDILARFQNERQVLAKLTHAGIARLYDGGATDDGRPYLVMELVDGRPIDAYCAERGLDVEQRLRLFLKVCHAIQHAHEQRVVHRDLKPPNILVTHDGQPKLLDFGIAKLLDASGSMRTVDVTRTELRLMTPEYASPEQVQSGKVDARSDVYALGVILYELLSGQRPYQVTTGLRSDLERAICEEDPARPSRRVDSRRLRTQLSGDLDTIVLTALRKEPGRRYASVRELAGDIERHLDGHRVLARPDTWRYRTTKFVRRNKLLVGSTLALILVLTAGLIGTLSMFLEAEAERKEGRAREYVARLAAATSALRANDMPDARRHLEAAPLEHRGWEWRHFLSRTDASDKTLLGDGGRVSAFAWSPDGRLLASGSHDGRVFLWDVESGAELRSWTRLPARVVALDFSPAGERLLATAEEQAVWMLDPRADEPLWTLPAPILRAVFEPSGERLACVEAGRILFLETQTGAEVDVLEREGIRYAHADFSPDGARLVFGTREGLLGEWELATREVRIIAKAAAVLDPLQWTGEFGFATTGATIAVGDQDGGLQLWDVAESELRFGVRAHGDRVISVGFDPAGERIFTTSMDRSVKLWNARTGVLLHKLMGHEGRVIRAAFHPTQDKLASGSSDAVIKLWNLARPSERQIEADRGWRMGLALHPQGTRLAAAVWGSWQGRSVGVASWDLAGGELRWRDMQDVPEAEGFTAGAEVVWSPDGERVLSSDPGAQVRVRDADTGELLETWSVGTGPLALAFSPDGSRVAAAREQIWILDAKDGSVLETFREPSGRVYSLAFSPDGRRLLTSSTEGAAQLWSVPGGELRAELPGSEFGVSAVAFDPRGEQLALAGDDNLIRLWSAIDLTPLAVLGGHTADVRDIAYSPDGERLVSGSVDMTVKLWDPREGRELATLHGHEAGVDEVEFSQDGLRIVSQDRNGLIRIWEAPLVETREDPAASAASSTEEPAGPQSYGWEYGVEGFWSRFRPASGESELSVRIAELEAIGYADGYEPAPTSRGVTSHDASRAYPGVNLFASGHAPEALLMSMAGEVLHRWHYDYQDLPGARDDASLMRSNTWRRVHLLPDGELLAIYEGYGLVKLDRSSNLIWYYGEGAHHDLEVQADGTIYVLTRKASLMPRLHPRDPILEDFVTILEPDGTVRERISILESLERSEFADILRMRSRPAGDILHTNTLEVLDGRLEERLPAFRRGNILISMLRNHTIAVLDPTKKEIVWVGRKDWRKQHQPTVLENGHLLLFDNQGNDGFSRVLELDPVTLEVVWSYAGDPPSSFGTKYCGTAERLPNGNTLISETCRGRAFEVTTDGTIVWEYWNPHRAGEQDELIAALQEMLRLPADLPLDWLEAR